jgi:orotate phosphoribosyltransferase
VKGYPVECRLPVALQSEVKDKRVAIVNDLISARSAVRGAFFDLQAIGAEVVAIGALLALGDSIIGFASEHHVALALLKQMPNNLWTPSQCPLCAAGTRLEIGG